MGMMMKHFRVKLTDGESFWFARMREMNIGGGRAIAGFKVDREGASGFTKMFIFGYEFLESEEEAEFVNEFTCGHRSVEMTDKGKCPKCFETKTGYYMRNVLRKKGV